MEITGVEIKPLRHTDGFYQAAATLYISGGYAVNGILIHTDKEGVKLRFPFVDRRSDQNGPRVFAFAPLNAAARLKIERIILQEYQGEKNSWGRSQKKQSN